MKTLVFEVIDGIKIVRAVGKPMVDPRETEIAARREILRGPMGEHWASLLERGRKFRSAEKVEREDLERLKNDVLQCLRNIQSLSEEHAQKNPVYFASVAGETLVENDRANEVIKALAALKEHEVLTVDGNVLADNRGRIMHRKTAGRWHSQCVSHLGETKSDGWKWGEDLTSGECHEITTQFQRDQIKQLSTEQREAALEKEINEAAELCARMKATLEIKGEPNATEIARRDFERSKAAIEAKYDVSDDDDDGK